MNLILFVTRGYTMNSAILICVVIAVNGAYSHAVQLPQSQKEKVTKYTTECITESGVNPDLLAEAKKGQFPEDEKLKKFALCFFKKADIVDNDGKLNIQTALAKLPPGVDKAETQKVLEECQSKTGKDAAEKVFEIYKCYRGKISTAASISI